MNEIKSTMSGQTSYYSISENLDCILLHNVVLYIRRQSSGCMRSGTRFKQHGLQKKYLKLITGVLESELQKQWGLLRQASPTKLTLVSTWLTQDTKVGSWRVGLSGPYAIDTVLVHLC